MKRIDVKIAGTLQQADPAGVPVLENKLRELLGSVHCSASDCIEVSVEPASSAPGEGEPAKDNKYTVAVVAPPGGLDDASRGSLVALKGSLLVLLSSVRGSVSLLFRCRVFLHGAEGAVDSSPAETGAAPSAGQGESRTVATPEEMQLMGEFVAEVPKFNRKQWIVSESVAGQFDDAIGIIRHQDKIFREWGFGKVDPNPRAIVCFYGKPGTGKSMAAHVLAAELGKKVICAKYSQIESKYVGDAPKRLRAVFRAAEDNDAVLFFDEADSFLGKRIENVSSGSDQAINSLRGEMLILLEDFKGVVVFASNLVANFDRAFESRILTKIEFELPNREARKQIIRSKIPAEAPVDPGFGEAELDALSELSEGFSGRTIRNAMLMSFVKGARRSALCGRDCIAFDDFKEAFTEQKAAADALDALHGETGLAGPVIKLDQAGQEALEPVVREALAGVDKEK